MQIRKMVYGITLKTGDDFKKVHFEAEVFPTDKLADVQKELMDHVHSMAGGEISTKNKPNATAGKGGKTDGKGPEKPAAKASRSKAKKPTPYDRDNKEHKGELSKILHANFEGWNKKGSDTKKRAGEVSLALVGEDLLDANGDVLDSFSQAVIDGMTEGGDDGDDL